MKAYALCSLLFLKTLFIFSMDWPTENGMIVKNFGWNDQGRPTLGVSFVSEGPIGAADQAELLFQHRMESTASKITSPLGSWVALDHGGGIVSVYSRMAENEGSMNVGSKNEGSRIPVTIEKNSPIGESGVSGWSEKKGVHFSLFDRKGRRWINPVMIVTPLPQSRLLQILSVRLRNSEGRLLDLAPGITISQDRYTVLVEAAEIYQRTDQNPLAPFKIICSINGSEIGGFNFEAFSARDGSLMVYRNGLIPVRQIYAPYPAFELGTVSFARGQVSLEIIAQNAAGTSRNAVFRFTVE